MRDRLLAEHKGDVEACVAACAREKEENKWSEKMQRVPLLLLLLLLYENCFAWCYK
jgi:hypothetical protein